MKIEEKDLEERGKGEGKKKRNRVKNWGEKDRGKRIWANDFQPTTPKSESFFIFDSDIFIFDSDNDSDLGVVRRLTPTLKTPPPFLVFAPTHFLTCRDSSAIHTHRLIRK